MMRPENLFNNTIVFPVESSLLEISPLKLLINQIQETIIVASVKAFFTSYVLNRICSNYTDRI